MREHGLVGGCSTATFLHKSKKDLSLRDMFRGDDGPGQRVPGAGGSPAGAGGAPGEAAERPERHGGDRQGHPDPEEEAYNARPHQAVTVAPEDVETKKAATFRVLRDNAEKFEHNKNLTEGRQRRLEEAGALGPDERGEELPAAVRAGAGAGGLRLDDGAGHGRLGEVSV